LLYHVFFYLEAGDDVRVVEGVLLDLSDLVFVQVQLIQLGQILKARHLPYLITLELDYLQFWKGAVGDQLGKITEFIATEIQILQLWEPSQPSTLPMVSHFSQRFESVEGEDENLQVR